MRPKISVIIPLYNKEIDIQKSINSVINQKFKEFELIVVDDGSTDNSKEIAESIKDSRLSVVTQNNQGVSAARNQGIFLARSDYIAFLDADDYWAIDHLSEINTIIEKFPGRGLYSSGHAIVSKGSIKLRRSTNSPTQSFLPHEFFNEYARDFSLVNSSTACIPKRVLNDIGGFPIGITRGEDVSVWLRAALCGGVAYTNAISSFINRDANNRSSHLKDGKIAHYIEWIEDEIENNILNNTEKRELTKLARRSIILNAMGSLIAGDEISFRNYRSLRLSKSMSVRAALLIAASLPKRTIGLMQRLRHSFRKPHGGHH